MGATILPGPGMVARALVLGQQRVIEVREHDKQRTYLQELRERCNLFVERPEKFPELYGDVRERWPDRRTREHDAKIAACIFRHHDLVDKRVGMPRSDGSVWGVSQRKIALETGIGDVERRYGERDWEGRRIISARLRAFHLAGYLGGHRQRKQLNLYRPDVDRNDRPRFIPGNRRWQIGDEYMTKRGPRPTRLAGRWVSFPTVRRVEQRLLQRLELDVTAALEQRDAEEHRRQRGPGQFLNVQIRRLRDREIKFRQRLAAKQSRRSLE